MLRGIHSQVFTRFEQNQNFNPDLIPSHASINPDQYIERNFLSTLFSIEARYLPNKQIFLASQIPSQAIIEIQRSLMSAKQVGIFLSNQDRLRILYSTFRAMGYRIGRDSNGGFLTLNLLDADVQARGMLSCRFSLLAYGIAQELGWNVTVRRARNHIYLHWKDEHGNPFNMDVAIVNPAAPVRERYSVTRSFQDPFYIRHYELPSETIGLDAIYLRDLTEQELISEVYDSIGFEMA
ncbi:MAG: hypothetical protein COS89_01190, partial [Deltaproteobacteria bacterium CG07_land_8_20_14_0_80_38_7]